MARILILQNDAIVPPGRVADVSRAAGFSVHMVPLWNGEPIPEDEEWDGIVALGGHMGSYDEAEFPHLVAEKSFLKKAVDAGVPTLGLCLGGQLLADALGGAVFLADRPEVGEVDIALTAEGRSDPVMAHLPRRALVFHQDTWTPPPGATPLAASAQYQQAFRLGSALALQPHLETTADTLDAWISEPGARRLARAAGTDPDALASSFRDRADMVSAQVEPFFAAWLREVAAFAAAEGPAGRRGSADEM